jgi:DHA1 family multidrug resistance protein-like MFS transporter
MVSANRRNIGLLFATMVIIMMGFGMVIPILPYYIEQFGAGGRAMGMLMAVYALMQFFFAPFWGRLSDQYGRKPILMVGVLGNALSQLLFGFSTNLLMMFIARALAGILSSATLPTAMAYIGDSTSSEERGGAMGVIGAAMGVGMTIGPGLAGWLAGYQLSLPFFVAAVLSLVTLAIIYRTLPESLPAEQRQIRTQSGQDPQLHQMWQALFGPIGFLLLMALLMSFGLTNFEGIFGLYVLDLFNYSPQRVGLIITVVGVVSAAVQGGLTGPLSKRWGEVRIVQGSLLVSAVGFGLMLLARDFISVLLTVNIFVLGNAMLRPVIASLTSKRASGGQGIAMGLNNAFMSLGRIIGPLWAGLLYDVDIRYPYLSGVVVMFLGYLLSLWGASHLAGEAELKGNDGIRSQVREAADFPDPAARNKTW